MKKEKSLKPEKGLVVKLITGGPSMTVEDWHRRNVFCVWFDMGSQLHRDKFEIETLVVVVSEETK